jgi:3'-phosphoadenosine 5'-phosphosulfate (PAPS) 3'-phosphatase
VVVSVDETIQVDTGEDSLQITGTDATDPVTEADHRSETVLRQALTGAFPDHGIIGEAVQLTGGIAAFPNSYSPVIKRRARDTKFALLVAGGQRNTKSIVIVSPAEQT